MSFFDKLFSGLGKAAPFLGLAAAPFTGGSSLLPLIATGLTAATSLYSALQGKDDVRQPSFAAPPPIEGPKGPPPDPTSFKRPSSMTPRPMFLGSGLGLQPVQETSEYATGATQGDSKYRSPEVFKRYTDLMLSRLVNEKGELAPYEEILPVDLQYLQQQGRQMRSNDTRGFLAALTRN